MKVIPFFIIFVEMMNIMKDFERQLIDFLKYIKEVHTDEYGNIQICDDGDEYDPTVERVVKDYLETMEGPNLENLGNISSTELSPELKQLVKDNWDYLIDTGIEQDKTGKYFADNADMTIVMERPNKISYTEDDVRELLIKGLTHNDDKLCGSLVTAQGEIRTANFNIWFEESKKK
jgi:hypothetical protein